MKSDEYVTHLQGTSKLVRVRDSIFIAKRTSNKNSLYQVCISNELREEFFKDVNHRKLDGRYQVKMSNETLWKKWDNICNREYNKQKEIYVCTQID